jgi:hypothetical protein
VPYYKQSKDLSHSSIAEYMSNHGLQVQDLSAVGKLPDMLVGRAGHAAFVEAKTDGVSHQKWTRSQLEWLAQSHHFNVLYAKSGEEAVRKFRQREFISTRAKDALAAMLAFTDKKIKEFQPNEIEPILAR